MSPKHWCASASPGERLVYHTSPCLALTGGGRAGKEVRDIYDAGLVDLVQRRNGSRFDYIAVKRRVPAKIPLEYSFRWMAERLQP